MRRSAAWVRGAGAVVAVVATSVVAAGCTATVEQPPAGSSHEDSPSAPVIMPGAPGDEPQVASRAQLDRIGEAAKPSHASVHYVHMMIPHHQQALAMTALAPRRADSPQVRGLAERIGGAQRAEIGMMQGWLERHGHQRVPEAAASEMSDHHRSTMGMATRAQMRQLKAVTGAEFDRLFLTLMITHHQGAVDMAVDVLAESEDPLVRSMAKDVVATQRDEIATMKRMLDTLG